MGLEPKLVRAPEFPIGSAWINTLEPLTRDHLQGQVVLFEFWDYSCITCLRALPYLRTWHDRYADLGFEIIGVHTPEFEFGKMSANVEAAVGRLGIRWPVVLDNLREYWTSFAVRIWPTQHLMDGDGFLRWQHQGGGAYEETETAIQTFLTVLNPQDRFPPVLGPLRPEDAVGEPRQPTTPELHIENLGNGPILERAQTYSLPAERSDGSFYLEGSWRKVDESLVAVEPGASVYLPYRAASVNAVFGYERSFASVSHQHSACEVLIERNRHPLSMDDYAEDVYMEQGTSRVRVDLPRSYSLVRHSDVAAENIRLIAQSAGLQLYAFSFGSCVRSDGAPPNHKDG